MSYWFPMGILFLSSFRQVMWRTWRLSPCPCWEAMAFHHVDLTTEELPNGGHWTVGNMIFNIWHIWPLIVILMNFCNVQKFSAKPMSKKWFEILYVCLQICLVNCGESWVVQLSFWSPALANRDGIMHCCIWDCPEIHWFIRMFLFKLPWIAGLPHFSDKPSNPVLHFMGIPYILGGIKIHLPVIPVILEVTWGHHGPPFRGPFRAHSKNRGPCLPLLSWLQALLPCNWWMPGCNFFGLAASKLEALCIRIPLVHILSPNIW